MSELGLTRSWSMLLAHLCYLSGGVVAIGTAVIFIPTILFLPAGLCALVVGVFWLGAARRIESGDGPTTIGRTFAMGTALLALVAWRLVMRSAADDPAFATRTAPESMRWLVALGMMALSVHVYCSLGIATPDAVPSSPDEYPS